MTYGKFYWADYYCGKCGTYKVTAQVHQGTRGEYRCNKCNQQVRETSRVTQEAIDKQKRKNKEKKMQMMVVVSSSDSRYVRTSTCITSDVSININNNFLED